MTDKPEEHSAVLSEEPTEDVEATLVDAETIRDSAGVTITSLETGEVVRPAAAPELGKPSPDLGKRWKGQQFVTTKVAKGKTEEEQKSRRDPTAISLSAYFVRKGVRNQVKQAAMAAYTQVRYGTVRTFDSIFATF